MDQDHHKLTFVLIMVISIMKLTGIYKNRITFFEKIMTAVYVIVHLSIKDIQKLHIIMPMAESTHICVV